MMRMVLLDHKGFNQVAKGRDGYYLYNVHDMYIGQAIDTYGEFRWFEAQLFEQLCRPGHIVLDVGANIGAHTMKLAKIVGPTGAVFAFEPQRLVFQNLCANVALNSLVNVECHWAALGAEPGFIMVPELDPVAQSNFGRISLRNVPQGREVPVMVLDDFGGLPKLNMIAIDVEGMERDVIEGGREMIGKLKPALYVANDRVDESEALMRLIDSLGYRMYWHLPPLFNPANFYEEQKNLYPGIVAFKLLCLHRDFNANLDGFEQITDFAAHPLRR